MLRMVGDRAICEQGRPSRPPVSPQVKAAGLGAPTLLEHAPAPAAVGICGAHTRSVITIMRRLVAGSAVHPPPSSCCARMAEQSMAGQLSSEPEAILVRVERGSVHACTLRVVSTGQ